MACLSVETAFQLAQGLLSPEDAARVDEHVDGCPRCRAVLATMARILCDTGDPAVADDVEAAAATPVPPRLARGTLVGRYVVLDLIGTGGMGLVYAAFDPELTRKVALKLVRPDPDGARGPDEMRARLLREAQAAARLAHPNIASIFDVGTYGDEVFLALELIEGPTLAQWLPERRRTWREIVDVFRLAGAGLAAAHAAGLVYRDFKPHNVIVGLDGRPRLVDFGLACPATAPAAASPPAAAPTPALASCAPTPALASCAPTPTPLASLTEAGALVGTPSYMAPEQRARQAADERSDQYSFCVALHEGLYGERPRETPAVDTPSRPHSTKVPRSVPRWVARVLQRGRSAIPGERYPSMEALLAALARDPRRRWWGLAAVTVAVIGLAAGGLELRAQSLRERRACAEVDRQLAGVWDADRRRTSRMAFTATGARGAEATWHRTAERLDAYAAAWVRARRAACEQGRRGRFPREATTRASSCLDARLEEVRALTDMLVRADAAVLRSAIQSTVTLSPLDRCEPVQAPARRQLAPAQAADDARIAAERARIARARAFGFMGKFGDALREARAAVKAAREVASPALEIEALRALAAAQARMGDLPAAEETLWKTVAAAEAGDETEHKAAAWVELVHVIGARPGRHALAERCARLAGAAIARLGGDGILQARLAHWQGYVAHYHGRYAEAEPHLRRAIALWEQLRADAWWLAPSLLGLGVTLLDLGRPAESVAVVRRALAMIEAEYGTEHPHVIYYLLALADALRRAGEDAAGDAHARRALATAEASWQDAHSLTAAALGRVARAEAAAGQHEAALGRYRRALAIYERMSGPDEPAIGIVRGELGLALRGLGRLDEAVAEQERAVAHLQRVWGTEHPHLETARRDLAAMRAARDRRRP